MTVLKSSTLLRRLVRHRRGAAMLEMALIAPVLLVMTMGMIDGSLWVLSRMSVERASRAGAEYAAGRDFNAEQVAAAIAASTTTRPALLSEISATPDPVRWCGCPDAEAGITPAQCGTACGTGLDAGAYVTASASGTHRFLLTWPHYGGSADISASTSVRIE